MQFENSGNQAALPGTVRFFLYQIEENKPTPKLIQEKDVAFGLFLRVTIAPAAGIEIRIAPRSHVIVARPPFFDSFRRSADRLRHTPACHRYARSRERIPGRFPRTRHTHACDGGSPEA